MTPTDTVVACADLVNRAGGRQFEIAWDCPHMPDEGDDHDCGSVEWTCSMRLKGAMIHRTGPTPDDAALMLSVAILKGSRCRCNLPVEMLADIDGTCRWQLLGTRWEPGCDVDPIKMPAGARGDVNAMHHQFNAHHGQPKPNRAQRRKSKRRSRGR